VRAVSTVPTATMVRRPPATVPTELAAAPSAAAARLAEGALVTSPAWPARLSKPTASLAVSVALPAAQSQDAAALQAAPRAASQDVVVPMAWPRASQPAAPSVRRMLRMGERTEAVPEVAPVKVAPRARRMLPTDALPGTSSAVGSAMVREAWRHAAALALAAEWDWRPTLQQGPSPVARWAV
jgi:hypothetical protein